MGVAGGRKIRRPRNSVVSEVWGLPWIIDCTKEHTSLDKRLDVLDIENSLPLWSPVWVFLIGTCALTSSRTIRLNGALPIGASV